MTIIEELLQYCDEIISGKRIACQKHKWAVERFLRDLARVGRPDFPWVFDEEKAQRFLDWMTFFKHTKGPLADLFINPHIIQRFIFGQIYGWVHKDTQLRRFRKAYWQVARKNVKSQSLAIMGLYEMACMEEDCSEVYVAATKKDQTRYVWGEADLIARRCEWLEKKIVTKYHKALGTSVIMHPKSDSFFARMSKDDKKKGDGSNPQCGLLDEYHAHETTEFYDVLSSGMKTRKQPILMIITTAGFELNNPCYAVEYDFVEKLLNPDVEMENDRYFALVCELDSDIEGNLLDDIKDERVWLKSNPIVAETPEGLESIRDELVDALNKPEKMRDFMTKTMNVWVNQRAAGYMDMAKWKACGVVPKKRIMPDLKGLPVYVGFDLSATIDLTSVGFVIPLPDERYAVFGHSFMPEATLFQKMKTDKVDYAMWLKKKWITATPGAYVDYRFMVKYVKDWIAERGLVEKEFCFDRALALLLMNDLSGEHSVVEIPQGVLTLSLPTKGFREQTYDGKIIHDNNPVISWAMSNAVVKKDEKENIQLDKAKAVQRIDPVAAIINAYVRAMVKPVKEEDPGVIFL